MLMMINEKKEPLDFTIITKDLMWAIISFQKSSDSQI